MSLCLLCGASTSPGQFICFKCLLETVRVEEKYKSKLDDRHVPRETLDNKTREENMNFTIPQQRAITSNASIIVCLAGAGAGKTSTLIARIKQMLSAGAVAPSEIVVITFTNAAARELIDRLGEAGKLLGYVGTLHGFMLRMIRTHGPRIGMSDKVTIIDEDQRRELIETAVQEMGYKGTKKALDAALNGMDLAKGVNTRDKAQLVAQAYWQSCNRSLLVDFDMMLYWGLRIIRSNPPMPYKALFVDEVQDSSDKDFEIYSALKMAWKFYVGDTDQAIYSFRGGNVENIQRLCNMPGIEVVMLTDNFRCPKLVCDAANSLISKNVLRIEKRTECATGLDGEVEVVKDFSSPVEEMDFVARSINARGQLSVAVLCSTNRVVSQFSNFLASRGVQLAEKKIDDKPEDWPYAKLLLQIAANVDNDYLVARYLQNYTGRSAKEVAEIKREAAQKRASINSFMVLFSPLESLKQEAVMRYLERYSVGFAARDLVAKHLSYLTDTATIADLVFSVNQEFYHRDEETEGVIVTTYHAFKGRERHTVYLPAFEAQFMPGNRAETPAELEERRRIAYVALTRSKFRLVVTCAKSREPHEHTNKLEPVAPSPYFNEANLV